MMRSMSERPTLSGRLRSDTRGAHERAERCALMQRLLAGRLPLADYRRLLEQFQALYDALESALSRLADHPLVCRLDHQALRRGPALADDLRHLHTLAPPQGPGPLVPATQAYVDRLQHLGRHDPPRLLAHAYVRYLGDLYGGQMVGSRLREQHGLGDNQGTHFYDFGDAARVRSLIGGFRAALDGLALTPTEADAVVAEACEAFDRHQQIFDQLLPAPEAAPGR